MQYNYQGLFGFAFSHRSTIMLAFLAVMPNIAGMLVLPTPFGFKLHFFQIFIFLAAMLYGKWGGLLSGTFGSLYIALALSNPFIIFGNALLGFLTGIFAKRVNIVLAVLMAFAIQAPWIYITDQLIGMPVAVVEGAIVSLLISGVVCAFVAAIAYKKALPLVQ